MLKSALQRQKFELGKQLAIHKPWYNADYEDQTNLLNTECSIWLLYKYKARQRFVDKITAPLFSDRETIVNAWCEKRTT